MTDNTRTPPPAEEQRGLLADAVQVVEHVVDVGLPAYIGAKLGSHQQEAPPPPPPESPIVLPPGVERE